MNTSIVPRIAQTQALDCVYNDDGSVAVLYSPGFGAGWYTWNTETTAILYDPDIVHAVLAGDKARAATLAEDKWPGGYWGGARDLKVEWMRPGTAFRINEYDGSESIEYSGEQSWIVAPGK